MKKNTAVTVTILAWDTILNTGKTGLADITLRGVGDGAEYTPVAAASQVDATNLPGVYSVSLTAAENNYNSNCIGGKSATANISIFGIQWINESEDFSATEKASLNAATPAASNMRGTDGAALASVCTEARLAELDAVNLPADIADIPTVAEFNARSIVSANYATAAILKEVNQSLNGANVVIDRGASTFKVYDTDGTTLLFTITKTTVGNVDTLTRT